MFIRWVNVKFILNRTPSDAVKITPAGEWFGRKTDVSRLGKFGCEAYIEVIGPT